MSFQIAVKMVYSNFIKYAIPIKTENNYNVFILNAFLTGEHFEFWLGTSDNGTFCL